MTSHKDFCAKEGLNFKLLADADHAVTKAYGSLATYEGQGVLPRGTRSSSTRPESIRKVYVKVNPATHSDDVLKDLAELQAAK